VIDSRTKAAAETFLGRGKHLDILVLNAGMLNHINQKTPHDQLEEHIAVNIALHLFTTTILPAT
jgi:NAD(P)-dependent dehydrogenase (short-subunit alcohol dehydrogenase family)